MQGNKPLDKGRVVVIAEKYDSNGESKNRYAPVGRATLWPPKDGAMSPNAELDIDTMPISSSGPVKMYIFWDSDSNNNSSQNQGQQQSYNQAPQNNSQQAAQLGYQQPQQGGYNHGQNNGGYNQGQ